MAVNSFQLLLLAQLLQQFGMEKATKKVTWIIKILKYRTLIVMRVDRLTGDQWYVIEIFYNTPFR